MSKKIMSALILFIIFGGLFLLLPTTFAQSQTSEDLLGLEAGAASGLGNADIRFTMARVISVVLSLLGIITTCFIVYAGFLWMTSGGNDDQVEKARKTMLAAVIGLLIVLGANTISRFFLNSAYKSTTGYTLKN